MMSKPLSNTECWWARIEQISERKRKKTKKRKKKRKKEGERTGVGGDAKSEEEGIKMV